MDNYIQLAKKIVLSCIGTEPYTVFLFGSRAVSENAGMSDIDIGILERKNKRLPVELKLSILEALEESVIPFPIDLVDFSTVSPDFKRVAMKKVVIWKE